MQPDLPAEPFIDPGPGSAIETVVVPRTRDLGGFEVRRALPAAGRQMVGPFIFFDVFGPVLIRAGEGQDVRPHPHIGLATVTWLFDGQVFHRDSLGTAQTVAPGELNWMTAGRGIVHSERTPQADRVRERTVFGIQSWVALPKQHEDTQPGFQHVAMTDLPVFEDHGVTARIVAGSLFGATSPVKTHSDLFYADIALEQGRAVPLAAEHEERGIYVADGEIEIAGQVFGTGKLLVFRPGDAITIRARTNAHIMMLGGEPMDGPRHIWWNFVASSKDKIEAAKDDWKRGRFDIVPGDEKEFIPLPEV
jgi:redox-sensitive bicupin YhaK (pirin superfamily)